MTYLSMVTAYTPVRLIHRFQKHFHSFFFWGGGGGRVRLIHRCGLYIENDGNKCTYCMLDFIVQGVDKIHFKLFLVEVCGIFISYT